MTEGGTFAERGECGIQFKSLTERFIDTTTQDQRLIFHIYAAMAEHQRSRMLERTRPGLATAAGTRPRWRPAPFTMTAAQVAKR